MNRPVLEHGLTLLELLIAIAVFTVVASIGYRGLQQTIAAKQQLTQSSDRFAALQHSMLWLQRDLTSLIARATRDHLGDSQPAFYSHGKGTSLEVEFTHGGRSNPAQMPQSTLQHVSYYWTRDNVIRRYGSRLDPIAGMQPKEIPLFAGASTFKWFFLDRQNRWHNQWPPLNYPGDTSKLLPRAVKVHMELPVYGNIERTFVTGSGT